MTTILSKGTKGDKVKELQEQLKLLGLYKSTIDGDFGRGTRNAVIAFQQQHFVDGIADSITIATIARAVKASVDKSKHLLLPVPHGLAEVEAQFGKIECYDTGGGTTVIDGVPVYKAVEITNDWVEENIVKVNLPIVGNQLVHKKMAPVFGSVLTNIKDRGLDGEIRQFGCWSPRHKMHNPLRNLSTHSWAIACDINWDTNGVGIVGDLDRGIVDAFERHGFEWGGRWSNRDDMHFQYCTGH